MYEALTKDVIYHNHRNKILYEFEINSTTTPFEFICDQQGNIFRKMKSGYWKKIENNPNHQKGYNMILVNKKQYSRAKLMLYAQKEIGLDEKGLVIYHKNNDKLDCNIHNLECKRMK